MGNIRRRALVTAMGGAWTPSKIAWTTRLEADRGVFQDAAMTALSGNGNVFNGWMDLSGNGNHAVRGDNGNAGVLANGALGGRAVLNWVDTGADYLSLDAIGAALSGADKSFDVVMVVAKGYLAVSGYSEAPWVLWNSGNATPFHAAWWQGANLSNARRDDANTIKNANYAVADDVNYHIFEWKFTGTALSVWQDGVLKVNGVDQNVGTLTANRFRLGATGGVGFFLRGGMACVYVKANANITDSERINLRLYLSRQYGISVSFS